MAKVAKRVGIHVWRIYSMIPSSGQELSNVHPSKFASKIMPTSTYPCLYKHPIEVLTWGTGTL